LNDQLIRGDLIGRDTVCFEHTVNEPGGTYIRIGGFYEEATTSFIVTVNFIVRIFARSGQCSDSS